MRLRLRRFRPRDGVVEYRVVQPWLPLRHTAMSDPLGEYGVVVGDHDGLSRLAALFSFAAYSRHTVVHVPLRDGVPLAEEGFVDSCGGRVDLVLMHHSLGLRPTAWPRIRRQLTAGTPLTVETHEARTERDAAAWLRQSGHHDSREWLRPVTYARTAFLIGSRDVFAAASVEVADAAGRGLREYDVSKGYLRLVGTLTHELPPDDSLRPPELDITFQARRPHHRFKRPGQKRFQAGC
ncbi:hypothetical protein [Embleya sp. NPDC050493]|uniref:hypothetical protein n=1 Tax=Embleya sp. NPDC050493 TaxID=3363989 RepID=UPI0037A1F914